jgi:hypothetical protein
MKTYYCHQCAKQKGLIEDPPTGKKVNSLYQYDKYEKHTQIDSSYRLQSIFSDTSTSVYADYMVSAMMEGAVEIDDLGRKNLIWCAGKHNGFRVEAGNIVRPTDAVKVVLSSVSSSVHAYPENSTSFNAGKYAECGRPIVF